ncbi:hypothetical protein CDAR_303831 [Caerostris darwini]|uniref:EGF-like domain-containing protein n=1 Tax=Caerostris darwini TaxID=1538125 RepID=A0AAV4T510_9ARAC|nr:hypothetical protein CDAR_303831 [Caerostris darwini]
MSKSFHIYLKEYLPTWFYANLWSYADLECMSNHLGVTCAPAQGKIKEARMLTICSKTHDSNILGPNGCTAWKFSKSYHIGNLLDPKENYCCLFDLRNQLRSHLIRRTELLLHKTLISPVLTCEDQDEFKLCKCKPGVLGGRCHVVGDCHDKYSSCEKERETCMSDVDCQNNGICKDKGGNGFCECKPEIKGDRCETVYDCTSGKYKNCKGENGTCSYNFDTNAAECRNMHVDVDCQNNGICKDKGGNGFCECKPEIKGDRCETVYDCTSGKYKNCKGENGTCSYNFDTNAAECRCYGDKKLHDQENICKDIIYSASTTESTTKHLTTITSKGICNDDKCLQGQCQVHGQVYRCKLSNDVEYFDFFIYCCYVPPAFNNVLYFTASEK